VLDGVRSIVMLGLSYWTGPPRLPAAGQGRIARYALGSGDYHDVIHAKLKRLLAAFQRAAPRAKARGVVDTAPLLEREFAQLADLGWVGKHTLLINKPAGSYFFLAALLTDQELLADEPLTADHCGTCRACLDACPTGAFPEPRVLDATRCISYLTIELRGPIPAQLRPGIGDWLFGCDVCQDVCPWNERQERSSSATVTRSSEPLLIPRDDSNPIDLIGLFALDDEAFRGRFKATPLWRARRRGILRNAAIVLGNQRDRAAVPALLGGLTDAEPLIRGACAWALGQIAIDCDAPAAITAALHKRQAIESDSAVRSEIAAALATATGHQSTKLV
jgi:epoxyqueuosine reductase